MSVSTKGVIGIVAGVFAGAVVLSAALGSFYTIDQGERGVKLRNGKLVDVVEPGLGYKIPFIEDVKVISVQTHAARYDLTAYSKDQQPADINVSVNFSANASDEAISKIYSEYGTLGNAKYRIIDRNISSQLETVFGQFTAELAITQRSKLVEELTKAVKDTTKDLDISSVKIERVKFTDDYEDTVKDRMREEVKVAKELQTKEREAIQADIVRIKAEAAADSKREQADAEAYLIRERGNAEAEAIKARSEALAKNPELVELTKAERWDGKLPTQMVPNSSTPFLNVGQK